MKRIIEGKPIIYLIASIIPLLSISIFLADLICSALAVLFLFYLIKSNFNFVYKNTFFIISIIFYFVCVISSIFSDDILFKITLIYKANNHCGKNNDHYEKQQCTQLDYIFSHFIKSSVQTSLEYVESFAKQVELLPK